MKESAGMRRPETPVAVFVFAHMYLFAQYLCLPVSLFARLMFAHIATSWFPVYNEGHHQR